MRWTSCLLQRPWRLEGFLSDTCFSTFKFGQAILSFFWGSYILCCVLIKYVSFNIDIAQLYFLKFISLVFQSLDWTRQHPTTNGGTGNCIPFISTSRRNSLPSSIAPFDPRSPNSVIVLLDNYYWYIKIRQSPSDFLYFNVMCV